MSYRNLYLFISIINLFAGLAKGQNDFAPIGAQWVYNNPYYVYSGNSADDGYKAIITIIKDTVLFDKLCKKMNVSLSGTGGFISYEYTYEQNDSIYYFNKHDNKFYLLYNFKALNNTTVTTHNMSFIPNAGFLETQTLLGFSHNVVSVTTLKLSDSSNVIIQTLNKISNSSWAFAGTINIQGIGNSCYFFGRHPNISTVYANSEGRLIQYKDNKRYCTLSGINNEFNCVKSNQITSNPKENDTEIKTKSNNNLITFYCNTDLIRELYFYDYCGILLNYNIVSSASNYIIVKVNSDHKFIIAKLNYNNQLETFKFYTNNE